MSVLQIPLGKDREVQIDKVIALKPELQGLGITGASKKLFFDTLDSISPMPNK